LFIKDEICPVYIEYNELRYDKIHYMFDDKKSSYVETSVYKSRENDFIVVKNTFFRNQDPLNEIYINNRIVDTFR